MFCGLVLQATITHCAHIFARIHISRFIRILVATGATVFGYHACWIKMVRSPSGTKTSLRSLFRLTSNLSKKSSIAWQFHANRTSEDHLTFLLNFRFFSSHGREADSRFLTNKPFTRRVLTTSALQSWQPLQFKINCNGTSSSRVILPRSI